jgi:hypothetical protein
MLEGTIIIDTPRHHFKNFDEARKWAKENIVGKYRNNHTGEDINISKSAIDKYLSASAVLKSIDKNVHLSALTKLPCLIETSILIETKKDRGNNLDIKEIQRFFGAINYENNIFPVKITVKVYRIGINKAYSYEVMKIETPININELSGQLFQSGQWEQYPTSSPHSDISDDKDTTFF